MTAPRKKKPTRREVVDRLSNELERLDGIIREAQANISDVRTALWSVKRDLLDIPERSR